MSKVSDIYDAMIVAIDAELTSYDRLVDPYQADENSELISDKAYGISFGPVANTERFLSCNQMTLLQDFEIILVNKILARDNDRSQHDAAYKSLMEDFITLAKTVCNNIQVGGSYQTKFVTHGGIEFLEPAGDSPTSRYLSLNVSITSEFREST